jgi:hypothetical protein
MNRTWQVHRDGVPHPDGQRCWDRAYQLLLQWADQASVHGLSNTQEDQHADRLVCAGLDSAATPDPHH